MKRIIIFAFLIIAIPFTFIYAADKTIPSADLSFYCKHDMVQKGHQELESTREYVFPNGTKINVSKERSQPIMLLNGSFEPNIEIVNNNNVSLIPIRIMSEKLGAKVDWISKKNKIIVKDNSFTITLKINDKIAFVNNKKYTLDAAPKIIKDTTYIPLRFICENMGLKVKYYKSSEIDLLWLPIITVDKELNKPYVSEKEAYNYLKGNLEHAYGKFKDNYKTLYNPEEKKLVESADILRKDIDKIKLTKTISRYYVFEGLFDTIYFDKYTRDIYFNTIAVSYSQVKKVNFDDQKLFEYFYMVD